MVQNELYKVIAKPLAYEAKTVDKWQQFSPTFSMNTSRLNLSAALFGAASLVLLPVGSTRAQTTAATVPVGYQQITVPAAVDAATPSATVAAAPFYGSAAFAGPVTTVDSASSLTSSSTTFTANQFAAVATPYLLHFKTGNSAGRYFLITANTTNQLTVANRGYDLTVTAAAADTFEIVPAYTLGTLLGTTAGAFQTSNSAGSADNVLLWNGSNFETFYFYTGTGTASWRKSGGGSVNQNNLIIYPDEGLYIVRRATSALTLTFLGTVPSTTERTDVFGPGSTFVSNRFPVDITLQNVGLQNLPGWLSASSANASDTVLLWNGSNFETYYYYTGTGTTSWRRAGGGSTNQNTKVIPSGTAMFVTRQSTASGTNASLAQTLPYSLN